LCLLLVPYRQPGVWIRLLPPQQNTSPITDPAELREIIVRQGAIIRSYQDQVEALQIQLCSVSTAAPRDPPSARGESPRLAMPEKFDGSADRCRGFLRQCGVFFPHQPGIYHEEGTRCAFLLSLLTSRALEWAIFRAGDGAPDGASMITAIDSQPIGEGYLKHQTELLEFQVGLFHHEQLAFYVTSSPTNPTANPMILGFPWLRRHDPQISCRSGSPTCLKECLREPIPAAHGHLPHAYADFKEVFSEERAARLPSHQVWDCAIDLLPNTTGGQGYGGLH
ncbi:hypothetical protein QTP86_015445, partial [Hemibagrus guttatus]